MAMKDLTHSRRKMVRHPLLARSQSVLAIARLVDESRPCGKRGNTRDAI